MRYKAIYGNIALHKQFCEACRSYAFVVKGNLTCCGCPVLDEAVMFEKREVEPEAKRRKPSAGKKKAQLASQYNRCIYCRRQFGAYIERNDRVFRLKVHWDHRIPYAYAMDNRDVNFVAACQVCNLIKHDKMFETIDEARDYLQAVWETKGFKVLP